MIDFYYFMLSLLPFTRIIWYSRILDKEVFLVKWLMSIKHLNESDGAMTDSIKADLQRVITTVEQVKQACNTIMNGVTVVRELASENSHGATIVVNSLHKLNEHNTNLQESTASSR